MFRYWTNEKWGKCLKDWYRWWIFGVISCVITNYSDCFELTLGVEPCVSDLVLLFFAQFVQTSTNKLNYALLIEIKFYSHSRPYLFLCHFDTLSPWFDIELNVKIYVTWHLTQDNGSQDPMYYGCGTCQIVTFLTSFNVHKLHQLWTHTELI